MDWERKILISEQLTYGKDLAKQLRNHLNQSSSPETLERSIQNIISSYEKALSMLNYDASRKSNIKHDLSKLESPCSFPNANQRSQASDQDCKDVYKKRRTMPQWTEQVKICAESGLEGTLDDGYCWRKYGQKDILGANFPRGYYRCAHRHAQGCLATKQVQRSDADPTIFEVTYRGRHTCNQNYSHNLPLASTSSTKQVSIDDQNNQQKENEVMLSFGSELKVKTEDLAAGESIFPSFSFGHENVEDSSFLDNNFKGSFSPSFFSPATSESNYFTMSPSYKNNFGLGHGQVFPWTDST